MQGCVRTVTHTHIFPEQFICNTQTKNEPGYQLRADYRGDQPAVQSSERSGCLLQLKTSLMAVSPSDSLN